VDLTEAHRLAQLRLGARTISQLRAVWNLLDPEDLDGTFAEWVSAVQPIVDAGRAASSRLAGAYFNALRTLELGEPGDVIPAGPLDPRTLITSMLVTGPVSIRANRGRLTLTETLDIAAARTSGAAMRHALNGGRETLTGSVRADRRAVGYQRVASGNACDFCAERAGATFAEDEVFEAHDRCGCAAVPLFR